MTPLDHAHITEQLLRSEKTISAQIGAAVSIGCIAVAFLLSHSWTGWVYGVVGAIGWHLLFVRPADQAWQRSVDHLARLQAALSAED